MGAEVRTVIDEIYERYWPYAQHDEADLSDPLDLDEDRDERADRQDWYDNMMEERRMEG